MTCPSPSRPANVLGLVRLPRRFSLHSALTSSAVGRTGSGKSTLTLALLHAIPIEGSIIYDGIDIGTLNLDSIRSSITIIPQVVSSLPVLSPGKCMLTCKAGASLRNAPPEPRHPGRARRWDTERCPSFRWTVLSPHGGS
jgi:hypothetical protein